MSTDYNGNPAVSAEYDSTTLEQLSLESEVVAREAAALVAGEAIGQTSVICSGGGGGGGGSGIDRSKPLISNIAVNGITGEGATVSWASSKRAISNYVEYSTDSSFSYFWGKADNLLNHSITLSKLTPSTPYNFRVSTIDEFGNIGTSDTQSFTTTDILGLPAEGEETGAEAISATADEDASFTEALSKVATYIAGISSRVSLNSVQSAISSQYALIRQLSELVPPPILGGEPRVITTSNSATISWSTDKESNSLIAIAPEGQYDASKGDDAYLQVVGQSEEQTNIHIVTIYDLEPDTTYHYQVRSVSVGGSLGKSQDFTFRTKTKELEISSYNVTNINNTSASFSWVTTAETNSQVKFTPYRDNVLLIDSSKTISDKNFTTIHELTVSEFESGVIYQVELMSTDAKDKTISKTISDFQTGKDNFPPIIEQVQTENALSVGKQAGVQTVISWVTNEPSTGQVYYQKGAGVPNEDEWQKTPLDNSLNRKHIVVITKFEPGAVYQFKILSADSTNNLSSSKVYTILTPREKETVFQIIIKNFEDVFGWTGVGR